MAETLLIPPPEPDADSRPYWEALRNRRVTYQHCRGCGENQLYFRAVCRACWSRDLEIAESAGRGTIYSFSVVHSVGEPALAAELPYALAIVQLDEGPRVMTRIEGSPDAVAIGQNVVATFRDISPEFTLLYFRREGEAPVAWTLG